MRIGRVATRDNQGIGVLFAYGLLFCLLILGGCASKESMSARYQINGEKPDGYAISKNVLLVADNQLNHLYGEPIWLRTQLVRQFVKVSIRPVQQDLFGQGILQWVLGRYGRQMPVIHLGDAANMACVGEFEAFLEIMATTGRRPWVMAPGNHDAYLMGNAQTMMDVWIAACERAGGPMTKDILVDRYLRHLHRQDSDFRAAFPDVENLPASAQWRSSAAIGETFLRAVAWTIDTSRPHRSFIVQELDLGLPPGDQSTVSKPITAILLDSSQYAHAPELVPALAPNAGLSGDLQPDQLDVVSRWMALANDATISVLMSHHPFGTLLPGSRDALDRLRKQYDMPIYVSAHTHQGQYFVRGGAEGWLELNVGSIVDYPIEFRTFAIHEAEDSSLMIRTPLRRIPDIWSTRSGNAVPFCDATWEAMPDDPDFYLTYLAGGSMSPRDTQQMLMTTLLHTYIRLIDTVPSSADNEHWPDLSEFSEENCCTSDAGVLTAIDEILSTATDVQRIDALLELGRFDKARQAENPTLHRDYRVCQAVWASKYNKVDRRAPSVTDPYITFSMPSGKQ
jgi:hypothetical protein